MQNHLLSNSRIVWWKWVVFILVVMGLSLIGRSTHAQATSPETLITINNKVVMPAAMPLGLNIGSYNQYGAAQYLSNLVPNPGFEPAEFAMMFLVGPNPGPNRVQPNRWDPPGNAHKAGFWDGAQYEILSGPSKGRAGTVEKFTIENNEYTFYLKGNTTPIKQMDVIVVRKQVGGFYSETMTPYISPVYGDVRPGSPGVQSLKIAPSDWRPGFYEPFDSFGRDQDAIAGKFRRVEGPWIFRFWAKPTSGTTIIEIKFHRVDQPPFHTEWITVTPGWNKYERRAFIPPGQDNPRSNEPLNFEIRIKEGEAILIDDMEIRKADQRNPTAFSDSFVNKLIDYRPGVLRAWGHNLGNSLDNLIAEPWARKTREYDPHVARPEKWDYSLHEFLQLCEYVKAEPWYVIPPTLSGAELQNLMAYLAAPAGSHPYANKRAELGRSEPWVNSFTKIHIEFGNEMWGGNTSGDPFRGASLWDGFMVGRIGGERLAFMRNSPHYTPKVNLILGGQAGFPERQEEIESSSSNHTSIAVAPYWGQNFNVLNENAIYQSIYAMAYEQVQPYGKMYKSSQYLKQGGSNTELMVYEINSHWTTGNIDIHFRNEILTSQASGIALPLHMLYTQERLGVRRQAAFTALQYSQGLFGRPHDKARIWGIWRDLEMTGRERPLGLAAKIVNKAIMGDFIETLESGRNPMWQQNAVNGIAQQIEVPYIHSFGFKRGNEYSLVLFNLNLLGPEKVKLAFPTPIDSKATVHTLAAARYSDDNETSEKVKIVTEDINIYEGFIYELPADSIVVLQWKSK